MANVVAWISDAIPQENIPAPPNQTWRIRNVCHSTMVDYEEVPLETNAPHVHFVRDSTRNLVNYFNAQWNNYKIYLQQVQNYRTARENGEQNLPVLGKLPFVHINGASGVGKSSEVFACIQTVLGSKAFIHKNTQDSRTAHLCSINVTVEEGFVNHKVNNLSEESVLQYLLNNNIDIIVVDGACSTDFLSNIMRLAVKYSKFLVLCISGQSILRNTALLLKYSSGVHPVTSNLISSLIIDGFSIQEYDAASDIIPHTFVDNTPALRRERYYYAGGCAGIYYHCPTIAHLKNALNYKLSAVGDTSRFFSTGDASSFALNSLKTYLNGTSIIVSEYVAKKLSSYVNQSFVLTASNTLRDNPSFQGWIAELNILLRVRSCARAGSKDTWEVRNGFGDRAYGWRMNVRQVIDYDNVATLIQHRPTFQFIEDHPETVLFLVPSSWNDRGFDAIMIFFVFSKKRRLGHYRITPTVKILQCTIADSHSKKLRSTAAVMNALFPLHPAPNNTYSDPNQVDFEMPNIEYSILTLREKFLSHRVHIGDVDGDDQIQRWHANWQVPRNVKKYYFDDCDYSTGCNLPH